MKILVVGLCPYLITSRSKLCSLVLRHLYIEGHDIAAVVWGHDDKSYPPDEDGKFSFHFTLNHTDGLSHKHKIPLTSFLRDGKESVYIYESIKTLQPDVVITVGDYHDFLYMKSVRTFCEEAFKWFFIMLNYHSTIGEESQSAIEDVDSVLCTSESGYEIIKSFHRPENIDFCFVGSNPEIYKPEPKSQDKFRIMAWGKNLQVENVPVIMEAVAEIRTSIAPVELYIHTNLYDNGDYNLEELKSRLDPNDEFIRFPSQYVSAHHKSRGQ